MTVRVPQALSGTNDAQLLVDAVYYAVRVLRNSRRGYRKTTISTEPSPGARRLAELAIREIEATEGRKILRMDDGRVAGYITALENLLLTKSPGENDARDAERMLRKMRAKYSA